MYITSLGQNLDIWDGYFNCVKKVFTGLYPFVVIFYCCLQLNCLQLVCNFLQSPPIFQFVLVCFHLQRFFILHCSYNVYFHLLLVCSFKVIFHLFPFVVPLSIIEQSPKIMELLFVVTLSLFVVLLAKCVVSGTTNCLGGFLIKLSGVEHYHFDN